MIVLWSSIFTLGFKYQHVTGKETVTEKQTIMKGVSESSTSHDSIVVKECTMW